jgi:hypothetical protein
MMSLEELGRCLAKWCTRVFDQKDNHFADATPRCGTYGAAIFFLNSTVLGRTVAAGSNLIRLIAGSEPWLPSRGPTDQLGEA